MGAWIETDIVGLHRIKNKSHPTWVRGLKPRAQYGDESAIASHPTWVRGLKRYLQRDFGLSEESHPTWVRGLKL